MSVDSEINSFTCNILVGAVSSDGGPYKALLLEYISLIHFVAFHYVSTEIVVANKHTFCYDVPL